MVEQSVDVGELLPAIYWSTNSMKELPTKKCSDPLNQSNFIRFTKDHLPGLIDARAFAAVDSRWINHK